MTLRNAILAASVLAAPGLVPLCASAQPVTGPYVSLNAGGSYLQDQNIKNSGIPALGPAYDGYFNGTARTDTDVIGSGAVGWGFGNGFRVEIQGDYRQNRLNRFAQAPGVTGTSAGGQEQQYGGFLNGYYDFDLTPFGLPGFAPYVGVDRKSTRLNSSHT